MCFLMWFAIPPLMGTLKKPKCADLDGDICMDCMSMFPDALGDAMALDKKCKVCTLSHTLTHTCTLPLSHTYTLSISLTHTYTLSLTLTHTLSLSH